MLGTKARAPAAGLDGLEEPFEAMDPEQRRLAIEQLYDNTGKIYRAILSELQELLRQANPLFVLSHIPHYERVFGINRAAGVKNPHGDWEMPESQIEMLQALWLQVDPDELSGETHCGDLIEQIREKVGVLCSAHDFREMDPTAAARPDGEKAVTVVRQLLRGATDKIRNRSYHSQIRRITRALYAPFDARLLESRGFAASDIPDVFDRMLTEIHSGQTDHLATLMELFARSGTNKRLLVENYHDLVGLGKDEAERFIADPRTAQMSLDDLRVMIMSHHDQLLPEVYAFSASDLAAPLGLQEERAGAILDEYALAWGDLAGNESGDFHRNNPVWEKPLVRLDDGRYFCPLPSAFFSFAVPCMEAVLSPFADEVRSRRAGYLEFKVAEIVERHFPGCDIRRNFRWTENDTTYEADLVACIDSLALVIECESGRITPSVLGGAPERLLREHVEKLLVEPNRKSLRLKTRLEAHGSRPDRVEPPSDDIGHRLGKVRRAVRVSVCLEDFRFIRSTLGLLGDAGWLPEDFEACPTMNLADFEMVFDLLEHPMQILHYLSRREAIEGNVGYLTDEHDLLGQYLTTLLDTCDAGLDIVPGGNELSAPLDRYYGALDAGVGPKPEKPRPAIVPLFASVFAQLEREGIDRWPEIGVALGMFSPDDQNRVSKILARLEKGVLRDWKRSGHRNTVICTPAGDPTHALGYVMVRDGNADGLHGFMEQAASAALESGDVRAAVVIARNIDRDDVAYDAIALHEALVEPEPGDIQ